MKKPGLIILLLMSLSTLWGQNERKVIREGVRAYEDGDFNEAEIQFRKAGDINQGSFEAEFNTGAALYEQEKYEETVKQYETLLRAQGWGTDGPSESLIRESGDARVEHSGDLAKLWHNMGNGLLEARQYAPSIEAYKNSLRLNPGDFDSKYNLAYARKKLQEQQQQQQQQQDQEENKDQQDQQNKEQGEDQQDQQNREQGEDQQDQQQGSEPENEEAPEQQGQPQAREISKEDAERMLNAIQQQEKEVKDKVDKKKAAAAKVKTEKDW